MKYSGNVYWSELACLTVQKPESDLYVYDVTGSPYVRNGKCGSVNQRSVLSRSECQKAATAAGLGTIGDTPANQYFPRGCFQCTAAGCSAENAGKVLQL